MMRKSLGILMLVFFIPMWLLDMLQTLLLCHSVSPMESWRETWWTWKFTFWRNGKAD